MGISIRRCGLASVSSGCITYKLFLFETKREKKGTKVRPRTRRRQQICKDFSQNGERTWEEVDKDLWEDEGVLLLDASQNFEASRQDVGTGDK
jgi:hypothetical protein